MTWRRVGVAILLVVVFALIASRVYFGPPIR